MSNRDRLGLHHLDQCLHDREGLTRLKAALTKIEKCCTAVDRGINLAEVVRDPANFHSLAKVFGDAEVGVGIQLLLKVALDTYTNKSFTINHPIDGERKMSFLYRSLGGWKQFDMVVILQIPDPAGGVPSAVVPINPRVGGHWEELDSIPEGTLVTVYLRTTEGKRSPSQEILAAERVFSVFDMVQHQSDELEANTAPVVQVDRPEQAAKRAPAGPKAQTRPSAPAARSQTRPAPAPARRDPVPSRAPSIFEQRRKNMIAAASGTPAFSFKVVINKMDTFVHAGNAQLIVTHLKDYQGRVEFFVLRGERQKVQLDTDSIWGAEIRNGETVQYDFFGPEPDEEFVKELAKKTNKYTQMDKLAEG